MSFTEDRFSVGGRRYVLAHDAAPPSNGSLCRAGSRVSNGREQGAILPAPPIPISDRAFRHRIRVTRTAKLRTSGAMARAASMTVASAHPAALAVHSGNVTDKPRPEGVWGDGSGSVRRLDRGLDPVLLRHGYHRPEFERSVVPPLDAGDQLRLG